MSGDPSHNDLLLWQRDQEIDRLCAINAELVGALEEVLWHDPKSPAAVAARVVLAKAKEQK